VTAAANRAWVGDPRNMGCGGQEPHQY
jgi:hypothetical protein